VTDLDSMTLSIQRVAMDRLTHLSRSVVVTWATTFAFIAILIGVWIHAKTTIEEQLHEQVLVMAQLAADRTVLTFDSVGNTLQAIGDDIQSAGLKSLHGITAEKHFALQTMLIRARGRNPGMVSLLITDPLGRVIAISPIHLGESATVPQLKDVEPQSQEKNAPTVTTAPFRDPATNRWLVRMTYRISADDGTTIGMLIANVAIDEAFGSFFQHYPLPSGDIVALHDAADRPLAVFPQSASTGAERYEGVLFGSAIAAEQGNTVRYATSQADDSTQLIASRKLARYPLYVVYGKTIDSWLLRWRQEQFGLALAAVAALFVTTVIASGIQRRLTLTEQLQKVRCDLEESNVALRATLAAAELLAAKDQLTGLWNRRSFDQRLDGVIAHSARHGDAFSLLMIDIDHFKNVNDYYGHATGDDVLKRFGEVLGDRLRQYDVAARWGGEEFVVLTDGANLENACMIAEQVRESIANTPFSPVPRVTVSIGVAEYREGESGDDLLKRADKALYGAKRNGRNRVIAADRSNATPTRQSA